jgi:hypothetical protein
MTRNLTDRVPFGQPEARAGPAPHWHFALSSSGVNERVSGQRAKEPENEGSARYTSV